MPSPEVSERKAAAYHHGVIRVVSTLEKFAAGAIVMFDKRNPLHLSLPWPKTVHRHL